MPPKRAFKHPVSKFCFKFSSNFAIPNDVFICNLLENNDS